MNCTNYKCRAGAETKEKKEVPEPRLDTGKAPQSTIDSPEEVHPAEEVPGGHHLIILLSQGLQHLPHQESQLMVHIIHMLIEKFQEIPGWHI